MEGGRQELMAKLLNLAQRGATQEKQGKFLDARATYLQIAKKLKEIAKDEQSPENINLYRAKMKKYLDLAQRAQERQSQKEQSQKIQLHFPVKKRAEEGIKEDIVRKEEAKMKGALQNMQPSKPSDQKKVGTGGIGGKMKAIDPEIEGFIIKSTGVRFTDIVGMNHIKDIINETILLPRKRPDLFRGIRAPPRGILFYGPPGNGKTLFAKAIATEFDGVFISLSASSIVNKYVGESEKTLRKIFTCAQQLAPTIIFIDQIDSILTSRSVNENEGSRRLKTEFLVLMDGMLAAGSSLDSDPSQSVVLIGATNLPKELDPAALRRFGRIIYIGMPDRENRQGILIAHLKGLLHNITKDDFKSLAGRLEGYSASEIKDIVKEASMIPLRQIRKSQFESIPQEKIRKINPKDFQAVLAKKKPLLTKEMLKKYQCTF